VNPSLEIVIAFVVLCVLALWRRSPRDGWVRILLISVVPICIAAVGLFQTRMGALLLLGLAAAYLVVALVADQVVGTRRYRAWQLRDFAARLSNAVNEVQVLEQRADEHSADPALRRDVVAAVDRVRGLEAPDAKCAALRDDYAVALEERTGISEVPDTISQGRRSDRLLVELGRRLMTLAGE
jgi:hypothetical protein